MFAYELILLFCSDYDSYDLVCTKHQVCSRTWYLVCTPHVLDYRCMPLVHCCLFLGVLKQQDTWKCWELKLCFYTSAGRLKQKKKKQARAPSESTMLRQLFACRNFCVYIYSSSTKCIVPGRYVPSTSVPGTWYELRTSA